ncbi:MAG TPA: DUF2809 domain-containing protein [Bryobacteraceae bacterium]|nr:DUF2809 domain-containing protein [Bryobacteraceae bacterium]
MQVEGGRGFWCWLLAAIVAVGLLSRVTQTGFRLVDEYLGDALYAAMVYVLFRLTGGFERVAVWAAVAMLAIELFQLTGIAAAMLRSGSVAARLAARLLGTHFSVFDLFAYAAGIGCTAALDRSGWGRARHAGRGPNGLDT